MRTHNIWVVVPAAGSGRRMGAETPKQYLQVAGRSMLDWTLHHLLQLPEVSRVTVAVSAGDQQFAQQSYANTPRVRRVNGGETRAESVLSGLRSLAAEAHAHDCVLVHDAARPLVHPDDLRAVIQAVAAHPEGGVVLANPVVDTLKSGEAHASGDVQVAQTVDREGLWQAQTPQAARFGTLLPALEDAVELALRGEAAITDEAGALEQAGIPVHLIPAGHPNFKLTTPADLAMAEALLLVGKRSLTK